MQFKIGAPNRKGRDGHHHYTVNIARRKKSQTVDQRFPHFILRYEKMALMNEQPKSLKLG